MLSKFKKYESNLFLFFKIIDRKKLDNRRLKHDAIKLRAYILIYDQLHLIRDISCIYSGRFNHCHLFSYFLCVYWKDMYDSCAIYHVNLKLQKYWRQKNEEIFRKRWNGLMNWN